MYSRENSNLKKYMEKYNIPFNKDCIKALDTIFWFYRDMEKEENFDKLVKYLKTRSKRDVYNRKENDKEFRPDTVYDWSYYLIEYSYFIKEILHKTKGIWISEKDAFPDDFFDIVHKHRYSKTEFFFKYMEEHYPESIKRMEGF